MSNRIQMRDDINQELNYLRGLKRRILQKINDTDYAHAKGWKAEDLDILIEQFKE